MPTLLRYQLSQEMRGEVWVCALFPKSFHFLWDLSQSMAAYASALKKSPWKQCPRLSPAEELSALVPVDDIALCISLPLPPLSSRIGMENVQLQAFFIL